ncbi:amidase signature enzyme [Wilcoxina mikolae CBS 423.85]|nr:amidase signature enzyme [Wilcoxina mikolae CBS 423.85]
MPLLSYLQHRRACKEKQSQRANAIASLPAIYHAAITPIDADILNTPVSTTAERVRNGQQQPLDVLHAYGKRALWAHEKTNCLTEIVIAGAESSLSLGEPKVNLQGPLAGIPVSLKDTINIVGYDSCIGYSKHTFHPATHDAPVIRLLRDAGAVPFVKTNVPITLLALESTNDVFGRTKNPHVPAYSPGGSTGGEGALLALGGSRIGIGTDVAGSVRIPAAWSGIYALRCSTGRFPKAGNFTSMVGQEGVPSVYSPMAKTLPDLRYFLETVINMKPWKYDFTVHPIPWRTISLPEKPRWGVLRDDAVVPPTPPVQRALDTTISALRSRGDDVVELAGTPSCYTALRLASRLLNSDAGETYSSHFSSVFESNDAGVTILSRIFSLPRFVKRIYAFFLRLRGDTITAGLIDDLRSRSVTDQWKLVAEREAIRAEWFAYLKEQQVDFVLTPVHPLPGLPEGGGEDTIGACGYTFLWNLLDYAAGVVPVGKVDGSIDGVTGQVLASKVARKAWKLYDAKRMEGLPIAVQIVGGRLEEEKVLEGMERVVDALKEAGVVYQGVEVEVD